MKKVLNFLAIYLLCFNTAFSNKSDNKNPAKEKQPSRAAVIAFVEYISTLPEVKKLQNKRVTANKLINNCIEKKHDEAKCKNEYKQEVKNSIHKIEKAILSRLKNGDKKLKALYEKLSPSDKSKLNL